MNKLAAFLQGFINSMRILNQMQNAKYQKELGERQLALREKLTDAQIKSLGAQTLRNMLQAQAEQQMLQQSNDIFNTAYNLYLKQGLTPEEAKLRAFYVKNNWIQKKRLENGVAVDMVTGKMLKSPMYEPLVKRLGSIVAENLARAKQYQTASMLNLAKTQQVLNPKISSKPADLSKILGTIDKALDYYFPITGQPTDMVNAEIKGALKPILVTTVNTTKDPNSIMDILMYVSGRQPKNGDEAKKYAIEFLQNKVQPTPPKQPEQQSEFKFTPNPILFNTQTPQRDTSKQNTVNINPKVLSLIGDRTGIFNLYNPRQLGQNAFKNSLIRSW